MKAKMLKLAGVKSEKEFYKKFPTEEAFMKAHGKEFRKAFTGDVIGGVEPLLENFSDFNSYKDAYKSWEASGGGLEPFGQQIGQPANTPAYNYTNDLREFESTSGASVGPNPMPDGLKEFERTSGMTFPKAGGKKNPNIGKQLAKLAPGAGKLIEGISMIGQQKNALKSAEQMKDLSELTLKASRLRPEQAERKYLRPEDNVNTGEAFFPIYGVGTNPLAKNGTEIANTFAPNTIYDDLGYEPLYDSERVKQFFTGGKMQKADAGFMADLAESGFGDKAGGIMTGIMGESAGGSIGGTVGKMAGTAIAGPVGGMIGQVGGQLIGGLIDGTPRKIKKLQGATDRNIMASALGQGFQGAQSQYTSFMEDGGNVNPQIIKKFGNYSLEELLAADPTMNTLRAGGHLKAYTEPSARALETYEEGGSPDMQEGGELQTHWGGYAEPISQNPYLPDAGETIMFRGQSHDEADGQGNTGIGITYGDSPVEVERGEPAVKLENGGGESLVVFGNLKVPSAFVPILGEEAKGKKFKNYVADLSKKENKQNKIIDKSSKGLEELNVSTPFDKLTMESYKANILGANMKLKNIAQKKMDASELQNAMNTMMDLQGLEADDNGIMRARKGASIPKAENGIKENPIKNLHDALGISPKNKGYGKSVGPKTVNAYKTFLLDYMKNLPDGTYKNMTADDLKNIKPNRIIEDGKLKLVPGELEALGLTPEGGKLTSKYGLVPYTGDVMSGIKNKSQFTVKEWDAIADKLGFKGKGNKEFQEFLMNNPATRDIVIANHQRLYKSDPTKNAKYYDEKLGAGFSAPEFKTFNNEPTFTGNLNTDPDAEVITPIDNNPRSQPAIMSTQNKPEAKTKFPWMDIINQTLPYLRPTDAERLDPNQLAGEMYALSQNQLEPVQSQLFQPELNVPYDISLQDILNENQADFRSQQRMVGYNPAVQGMLNAQKYAANQKVKGEQFRLNQAQKQSVYADNRNVLNDAKLKNLSILDTQYQRQAAAKSNTKATTQAALNSIASKYAQNKLEGRTLQTYENLYNYRFDPAMRAINTNPLVDWDAMIASASPSDLDRITKAVDVKKPKKDEKAARNGSIVKALKNF